MILFSSSVALGTAGCTRQFTGDGDEQSLEIVFKILIDGPDDEQPFFDQTDIEAISEVDERNGYIVPIQLTESGQETAIDAFHAVGADRAPEDASITMLIDGDITVENTFKITPTLEYAITTNEWDGTLRLQFNEQKQAEAAKQGLRVD